MIGCGFLCDTQMYTEDSTQCKTLLACKLSCECLVFLGYKLCLCNPLVKVDFQLATLVLAADNEWLLQVFEVLPIKVLAPLTVVLPYHLIQNMDHLVMEENYLPAVG